jgi:putative FmdB family regulatory protein
MPIYEFKCDDCKQPFEKLVRSSAATAEVACPVCGSQHVTKKMSAFAARPSGGLSFATDAASSCSTGGT